MTKTWGILIVLDFENLRPFDIAIWQRYERFEIILHHLEFYYECIFSTWPLSEKCCPFQIHLPRIQLHLQGLPEISIYFLTKVYMFDEFRHIMINVSGNQGWMCVVLTITKMCIEFYVLNNCRISRHGKIHYDSLLVNGRFFKLWAILEKSIEYITRVLKRLADISR